jgi:hypothetical protein
VKRLAVIAAGVVAASFVVPQILAMTGIKQTEGFGLDDVLAALAYAAVIMAVDSVI